MPPLSATPRPWWATLPPLTDSLGGLHNWTWTGSGYRPPPGTDGVLARDGGGNLTLHDADGTTYTLRRQRSGSRPPPAPLTTSPRRRRLRLERPTNQPLRLRAITDPVLRRSSELHYCLTRHGGSPPGAACRSCAGSPLHAHLHDIFIGGEPTVIADLRDRARVRGELTEGTRCQPRPRTCSARFSLLFFCSTCHPAMPSGSVSPR